MNFKQLMKRMVLSFFIIFSGAVLSMYTSLVFFARWASISIEDMTNLILVAFLTNLTQLTLYSKKELSRRQLLFRYIIVAVLVVSITLSIAFYVGWIGFEAQSPLMALLIAVLIVVVVVIVLTVASRQAKLEAAAIIDPLTKAYNRRFFVETATGTLDACIKNNREFALIMLDLDHFKAINDTYGHSIGDEVLKISVSRVKHVLKKGTFVARYGGEEFVVMVTSEKREGLVSIARRIQNNLAARPYVIGDLSIAVTASFGIASKNGGENLEEIVNQADKALYKSKTAGRNAIVYYDSATSY